MKKFIILLFGIFLFSSPAIAQVRRNGGLSADNTKQYSNSNQADPNADCEGDDDFYNELIEQNYGSTESSDFNNNSEMNPSEANYAFEGSGSAE